MNDGLERRIREILRETARLPVDPDALESSADLFAAGMSSHASVSVMLALEDAFDLEFPDEMLKRDVFVSIDSMAAAVAEIQGATA